MYSFDLIKSIMMKLNLLRNFCAQLNLLHNTLCPLRPVKAQLVLVTKGFCIFFFFCFVYSTRNSKWHYTNSVITATVRIRSPLYEPRREFITINHKIVRPTTLDFKKYPWEMQPVTWHEVFIFITNV